MLINNLFSQVGRRHFASAMFVSRPVVRLFDQLRNRWIKSLSLLTGSDEGLPNLVGLNKEPMKESVGLTNWLATPLSR